MELMAATVSSPRGAGTPASGADVPQSSPESEGLPLGPIPHMIRGQLSGGFSQATFTGHAYRQCTACSASVVGGLKQAGWDFVLQALQVSDSSLCRVASSSGGRIMLCKAPWLYM